MGRHDDSQDGEALSYSSETGLPLLPGGPSSELVDAVARAMLNVGRTPEPSEHPEPQELGAPLEEPVDLAEALADAEADLAAREGDVDRLWALLRNPVQADRAAAALIHRMEVVTDRNMRPEAIRLFLTDLDDAMAVATLSRVLARARRGEAGARASLQELALDPGILGTMPRDRAWRLVGLAQRVGLDELPSLFFAPTVDKRGLDVPNQDNEFVQLPLGLRRQAARTTDRNLLDRLLRDTDHRVIKLVLDNPRLRERDVVTIAARRPTRAEVLRVVSLHPRWSSRYRVRKTLACNPYTPAEIAVRLLETLMVQDLRFIVNSGVLLPEVQAEARRVRGRRT